ncbi:protocatechuate 3,4-dioxygenase subunit alpha [Tunturiibacter empetritectus]|uniref:Protocatechuate 3,4-dioxygenase alpha subunit n=2 Tax=Tunturiibacter TaxID=3154218 RepID=A0A852VIN5_9BACT|nr:protocatechuate 3,4-dioxygenase alpha subunit [Edaphobacter lichenicola]
MSLQATTWQTVGPFFSIGLGRLTQADIAVPHMQGDHIQVQGRILDSDLRPIPDALLETWQANSHGKYAHPDDRQHMPLDHRFSGYGRIPTDDEGRFQFKTIKPGAVPGPNGRLQAPHLVVGLIMRGLLKGLVTRIYFPDEVLNEGDAILQSIPIARRETLLLRASADQPGFFTWDIHMQGQNETVFLEF